MGSSELGSTVSAELSTLGINTDDRVRQFRVPSARRASTLATVMGNIRTLLGKQWVSRKRIRHDALALLREGTLSGSGTPEIT